MTSPKKTAQADRVRVSKNSPSDIVKESVQSKRITKDQSKAKEQSDLDLNDFGSLLRFVKANEDTKEITNVLYKYVKNIITSKLPSSTEVIFLFDPNGSIGEFALDKIYTSIMEKDLSEKTILLFIHSRWGSIIPAYFISKQCRELSAKFQVVVPRIAKSAATLIALWADEIHMWNISHLWPIDPQIWWLPVLGLSNAVRYLASLCKDYPESGEMLAKYMSYQLNMPELGYFERIAESAEQYAQRLLESRKVSTDKAREIANQLVYLYKDHTFAIDHIEAKKYLWDAIRVNTEEYSFADEVYKILDQIDFVYKVLRKQKFSIIGSLDSWIMFIKEETLNW